MHTTRKTLPLIFAATFLTIAAIVVSVLTAVGGQAARQRAAPRPPRRRYARSCSFTASSGPVARCRRRPSASRATATRRRTSRPTTTTRCSSTTPGSRSSPPSTRGSRVSRRPPAPPRWISSAIPWAPRCRRSTSTARRHARPVSRITRISTAAPPRPFPAAFPRSPCGARDAGPRRSPARRTSTCRTRRTSRSPARWRPSRRCTGSSPAPTRRRRTSWRSPARSSSPAAR